MSIDRIVLSTDENETYIQFWPLVATAWKKYFPEVNVTLALLTNRTEDSELVQEMKKYGEVVIVNPVEGIPLANQAKMARHIVASSCGDDVCCLHDIDSCPLQRDYTENFVNKREINSVLRVGKEVLDGGPHEGKFPMSHITTEGNIWKDIINPNNLTTDKLFESWVGTKEYDTKEDISQSPYGFSDESLIRVLLSRWKPQKFTDVIRGVDIHNSWLDRSWWSTDSRLVETKLNNNEFVEANLLRPFSVYWENIKPVVEYICGNTDESIIFRITDYEK